MNTELKTKQIKMIVRQCHKCTQVIEAPKEQESCLCCGKSFLPINYFDKIHDHSGKVNELYASSEEIEEQSLVKGIFVIW